MTEIREYRDEDEPSWLRCRLLSFFETEYYDDIMVNRPTIDVLAVRPDHTRAGIASQLLEAVVPLLRVDVLDAWTRGDVSANEWYQRSGFVENFRYLHVYKSWQDDADGFETPEGLGKPVNAFMHAPISLEASMRARFRRVHVCRQYVRAL
ncbi:GNAT family N-acetyltransferase [Kribbella sindirgiensis]|uniref:N-acetyltransferase n=1 Tax=Kribbella sindirgiensis TaxID=1124744 RepID=A0A4R0JFU8_9ACTN|nr:GNAT family N-acetyltransferase [Kribbella sindirgiensis]TCC43418.1 N-acetyltransferase [Kribbella sindirgiensis]